MTLRDRITAYIRSHYGAQPEYLWKRWPDGAIFRHADNRKWFALLMTVKPSQLGLTNAASSSESVAGSSSQSSMDILDVKCDPGVNATLQGQRGFFPGYHMNHKNWITIVLDGSVPEEQILELLDASFDMTTK